MARSPLCAREARARSPANLRHYPLGRGNHARRANLDRGERLSLPASLADGVRKAAGAHSIRGADARYGCACCAQLRDAHANTNGPVYVAPAGAMSGGRSANMTARCSSAKVPDTSSGTHACRVSPRIARFRRGLSGTVVALKGETMLQRIKHYLNRIADPTDSKDLSYSLNPEDRELLSSIRSRKLTYLSDKKLATLTSTCRSIEDANLPGIFIEAGCALGGSAIVIATLKSSGRPFCIYDVFGMIPPPTKEDTQAVHDRYRMIVEGKSAGIDGDKYYGYQEDLYDVVQSNLRSFGINLDEQSVSLIRGPVQDTMRVDHSVAFAHVDVDWYEPVMTCLKRIFPNLVVGGSIILDDYHDWGGCRKATDEYLREVIGQFVLDDTAGSMKMTRVRS